MSEAAGQRSDRLADRCRLPRPWRDVNEKRPEGCPSGLVNLW